MRGRLGVALTAVALIPYLSFTGGQPPDFAHAAGLPVIAQTVNVSAEPGCNAAHPSRLWSYGVGEAFLRACATPDLSSLELTNVSSGTVLSAQPPDMVTTMQVYPPSVAFPTYVSETVSAALPSGCDYPSSGPCRLIPGARLIASGGSPGGVVVSRNSPATADLIVATALANRVWRRFTSPGWRRTASVIGCAEAAGRQPQGMVLEERIRSSLTFAQACGDLRDVFAPDKPERQAASATDDLLRETRGLTRNLSRDFWVHHLSRLAPLVR